MKTSRANKEVLITDIVVRNDEITVTLNDGRRLTFPLSWFPRLKHGTPAERNNWELVGDGYGVHWPDLDEDLSVEGFLAGNPSFESPKSLRRWLSYRARGKKVPIPELSLPPDIASELEKAGIDLSVSGARKRRKSA